MNCARDDETIISVSILRTSIFVALWTVGVLGNVVNMVVFAHKNMITYTVNRLFWWLSLSDLLELIVLILLKFASGWCPYLDLSLLSHGVKLGKETDVLPWLLIYLLLTFHSCTDLLNIGMACLRYLAVRYPLQNQSGHSHTSVKLTAIGTYIFSFISSSPILLYGIFFNASIDYVRTLNILEYVLFYGIILRVGLFLVLVVTSSTLVFTVVRSRRRRQRPQVSAQTATMEKSMRRITNLIIIILSMFFVSDIVMTLESVVMYELQDAILFWIKLQVSPSPSEVLLTSDPCNISDLLAHIDTLQGMKYKIAILQWSSLVNCSYSTLCYFIFSTAYRGTLKVLYNDWWHWMRPLRRENPGHVTLELHNVL